MFYKSVNGKCCLICICIMGLLSSCIVINDDKYPETFEPICKKTDCCKRIEGIYEIDRVAWGTMFSAEEMRLSTSVGDTRIVDYLIKLCNERDTFPTSQHILDTLKLEIRLTYSGDMNFTCYSVNGRVVKLKTIRANKDFTCKNGVVKFRKIVEGWAAESTWTTESKLTFFCSSKDNLIVRSETNMNGIVMFLPFVQISKDWAHLKRISN